MNVARLTTACAVLLCAAAQVAAASQQLLDRLRGDHAALVAAESDFRLQRERGTLGAAEANDYAAYVARLFRRVAEDCEALVKTGTPVPADIPCLQNPAPVMRAVPIDQGAERTGAERIAALDAELNAGLGQFDEMLLREQERVKATRPRSESGGGGGGGGGQDGGNAGSGASGGQAGEAGQGEAGQGAAGDAGAPGANGDRQTGGSVDGAGAEGDSRTGGAGRGGTDSGARGGSGTGDQAVARGRPADIPDGSDDDLVARQLREAAEKETDPELKKKLWEEYRKYKQGTR
jgi:hypothetical protein